MNKEEAIKIVRSYYPANKQMLNEALEFLIPELKEDENEKIRKEIIAVFKGQIAFTSEEDAKKYIAWLKKQGENSPLKEGTFVNVDEVREDFIQEVYRVLDADPTNDRANQIIDAFDNLSTTSIQKPAEWSKEDEKIMSTIMKEGDLKPSERKWFKSLKYRMQSKQSNKPQGKTASETIKEENVDNANKVEPKFKVGDWIVRKDGKNFHDGRNFAKIIEIDGSICRLDNGRWLYDYEIRPWSILDAEDGDILASVENKPFIYNGWYNESNVGAYCGFNIINAFTIGNKQCDWTKNENIRPATKKERQSLFNEMNLLGWIWNPETKELNRLDKDGENNN